MKVGGGFLFQSLNSIPQVIGSQVAEHPVLTQSKYFLPDPAPDLNPIGFLLENLQVNSSCNFNHFLRFYI